MSARLAYLAVEAAAAGNAVEQDDNVFAVFNAALGHFDHDFSHLNMAFRMLIKGRRKHFGLCGALHIRHLFRTFVDQQNDQLGIRIVLRNAVGDFL